MTQTNPDLIEALKAEALRAHDRRVFLMRNRPHRCACCSSNDFELVAICKPAIWKCRSAWCKTTFDYEPPEETTAVGDDLGDRMKGYERDQTEHKFGIGRPIYARIDGRGFSKFTKGLQRPFDPNFNHAMDSTTIHLVEKTKALVGYVQSDEISLVWLPEATGNGQRSDFFAGRVQKMVSVLASMATAKFMSEARIHLGDKYADKLPHFDCRVFQLPSHDEAANAVLWRALDAERNAIQMVAHANFSHKSLHGVDTKTMVRMLADKGINFDLFDSGFRHGRVFKRVKGEFSLSPEELARIPEKHRPTEKVARSKVEHVNVGSLKSMSHVERMKTIFECAESLS